MLQSLEKGATNSVHLEMRRKVGGREGFTQEGASKHQLFFPEKDPPMVSSPVPAPQGVTLLTIVVQEGTALHRWKNSLAYRTFFTLNFNLPCHSIRVGRKRSGAGGGGSSSPEVQKCLVVSLHLCQHCHYWYIMGMPQRREQCLVPLLPATWGSRTPPMG